MLKSQGPRNGARGRPVGGGLKNKPAHAVPLASARQHPENQKENQAGHSPERTVEGQRIGKRCGTELYHGVLSRGSQEFTWARSLGQTLVAVDLAFSVSLLVDQGLFLALVL